MENSSTSVDESLIGNLTISTDEEITVGIELGGSYSSIGIWHLMEDRYELIHKCRTSVCFDDGVELVGEPSLETVTENTFLEVTSFLGRKASDMSNKDYFPYKMVEGSLLRPVVSVTRNGHAYTFCSEELCSLILKKLKIMGETYLQRSVNKVVICVPSCFGTLQRQATLDAAAIAGLEVVSLIDETTSIAVAYYTLKKPTSRRKLIIGHLGFFAYDISIIEHTSDGKIKVVAKSTEETLGLHNYINKVMTFCIKNMNRTPTVDELIKLRIESERVIFRLSSSPSTKIDINDLSVILTRDIFHELIIDIIERTINHVRDFLYESNFYPGPVKCDAVLSGATLNIPNIGEQLEKCFYGKATYDKDIDISDFVTRGAAIHAAYFYGFEGFWSFEVTDVTHQAITGVPKGGIHQKKLGISIPKGAILPVKKTIHLRFQTTDKPSSLILTLHEGPKHIESKYSFLLGQGIQSLNICLEIDRNGILKVYAQDMGHTIVGAMANHKVLLSEDILSFIEKADRLEARDLELPVITEVGKHKMNAVLDASKDASLPPDGAKALSRYTKMVDDVIATQAQKIEERSEIALGHLNKMKVTRLVLALEGQAVLPTLLWEDVEAVQVSRGTAGLQSELQKLQEQRRLNHELLVQIEELIQKEADKDEQVTSQSGTRRTIPQSSTLTKTLQDRLSGLAAKLKQAADSDIKIEHSVRDHMALMSILDIRPIESALPILARPVLSLGANVGALKQSLKKLETLGAQREDLEAKLEEIKRKDDILPQLMTMTGSYEDLLRKEMLKYDHICKRISDNLLAQDQLLLQIQDQNNQFSSTFNIQDYWDSLEMCYKKMELAIAKYREIRENINERSTLYATLQQDIRNLEQQVDAQKQMSGLIDKDSRNSRSTKLWPQYSMVPCSKSPIFEEDTDSPKSDTIASVDAPRAPTPPTSNSRDADGLLGLDLDVPKGSAIEESNALALPIVTSGFQETFPLK